MNRNRSQFGLLFFTSKNSIPSCDIPFNKALQLFVELPDICLLGLPLVGVLSGVSKNFNLSLIVPEER